MGVRGTAFADLAPILMENVMCPLSNTAPLVWEESWLPILEKNFYCSYLGLQGEDLSEWERQENFTDIIIQLSDISSLHSLGSSQSTREFHFWVHMCLSQGILVLGWPKCSLGFSILCYRKIQMSFCPIQYVHMGSGICNLQSPAKVEKQLPAFASTSLEHRCRGRGRGQVGENDIPKVCDRQEWRLERDRNEMTY